MLNKNLRNFHHFLLTFKGTSSTCKTISGDTNRPCLFPFIYNDVEYTACTREGNDGINWCSTEVDNSGKFISDKWGNCSPECTIGN